MVKKILFLALLLGIWGQAAGACPESHVASGAAQAAIEITVSARDNFMVAGGEHRCECPATTQNAQAIVTESDKSLLASYVAEAGAFPNSSNPTPAALAEPSRASAFATRPSRQPPFLLVSRLLL